MKRWFLPVVVVVVDVVEVDVVVDVAKNLMFVVFSFNDYSLQVDVVEVVVVVVVFGSLTNENENKRLLTPISTCLNTYE